MNPSETSTGRRRRALNVAIVLGAVVLALAFSGCSELQRYRVLSFFFDGVPPPASLPEEERPPRMVEGPWGQRIPAEQAEAASDQAAAAGGAARGPQQAPSPVVYHEPFRQSRCRECHDPARGHSMPAATAGVCGRCHQAHVERRAGDWTHGPVALGRCTLCHRPHEADHEGLLTHPEPDLCWRCHESRRVLQQPFHAEIGEKECTRCHDPHSAGNRLLLADARTYERQGPGRAVRGHTDWSQGECQTCHVAEKTLEVVENVDEQCLTCHSDQLAPEDARRLHAPVRRGQCTLCHTPHSSPRPHLVKPQAEKLCFSCHEAGEVRTRAHPPVRRADCVLCHAGHSSRRPHLLKPGIPVAR
jgi:predicted CXXCH cytochrome family protein